MTHIFWILVIYQVYILQLFSHSFVTFHFIHFIIFQRLNVCNLAEIQFDFFILRFLDFKKTLSATGLWKFFIVYSTVIVAFAITLDLWSPLIVVYFSVWDYWWKFMHSYLLCWYLLEKLPLSIRVFWHLIKNNILFCLYTFYSVLLISDPCSMDYSIINS